MNKYGFGLMCLILLLFGVSFSSAFTTFLISPESANFTLSALESSSSNLTISFNPSEASDQEIEPYKIERNTICNQYDFQTGDCIDAPPNLCPYLSIEPNNAEDTEIGFSLNASSPLEIATGELTHLTDEADNWTLSITSPCFEGECPANYDPSINGEPLPQSLKGQTFKCNLFAGWNGEFQTRGLTKTAYAAITDEMEVSAVFTGGNVVEGNSSVLFIPGFMASDLYVQGTIFENQLWPPTSLLKSDIQKLMLDSSGNPVTTGIYTKGAISEAFGFNIYKSFIQRMNDLVTQGDLTEWKAFPYDWRKDISKVVNESTVVKVGNNFENKKLIDEAIALAQRSPTGKIMIISHSNGGLVGKALVKELVIQGKGNIVDQFVMVATPQIGTPKAIASLLHGDQQAMLFGLLLDKETARSLGRNMQSGYNLLPSQSYFNNVSDPVIKFEDSINQVFNYSANGFPQSISNYSGMLNFLTSSNRGSTSGEPTNIPGTLISSFASNANTNVESLASWQIPSNIKVTEITGWGEQTIKGIDYRSKQETVCSTPGGLYVCQSQSVWDRKLLMTDDGDGTVVIPSATNYDTLNEYYLNLFNLNDSLGVNLKHHNILEASSVLDLISEITKNAVNNSSLPNYLYTQKPAPTNQNLQISVHSPVSLGVTNFQGKYTGLSSTLPTDAFTFIKEEIPNSYYLEIGDDKYIGLSNGGNYAVNIQGEGTGTFTFNQEVTRGDQTIDSKSFIDIPVTPLTKASLALSSGSLSPTLNLDTDGNGSTDVQVQANNQFDPITYLTVMKSVIKSFNLKKAQENNLINKIDNLIKLIQKGKIQKASAKSQIYVNKLNQKLEKINNGQKKKKGRKLTQEEIQIIIQNLEEFIDNLK